MLLVENIEQVTVFGNGDVEDDIEKAEIRVGIKLVKYGNSYINKCIKEAKDIDKENYSSHCFCARMFFKDNKLYFHSFYYIDVDGKEHTFDISSIEKYNICNITALAFHKFLKDRKTLIESGEYSTYYNFNFQRV